MSNHIQLAVGIGLADELSEELVNDTTTTSHHTGVILPCDPFRSIFLFILFKLLCKKAFEYTNFQVLLIFLIDCTISTICYNICIQTCL